MIGKLAAAIDGLNGTEAVITVRFEVNDEAVIRHPLLGDAAEAILAGEGRRGDHP
jgi:hypothetical protein